MLSSFTAAFLRWGDQNSTEHSRYSTTVVSYNTLMMSALFFNWRTDISVDLSNIAPRSHPRMTKVGSEPISGCVKLGLFHEDFEK